MTAATEDALLRVKDLTVHFPLGGRLFGPPRVVQAVNGVSFALGTGKTLSLVGESGCGKTTVARSIMGLNPVTAGRIELAGRRIDGLTGTARREVLRNLQFVFQDPFSSLNPRMRVREILAEPLRNFGLYSGAPQALQARVRELMDLVRLPAEAAGRFPHEFSGGQRQRIGIARALALNPKVLICDEAVSALDVSVQAQIINLFRELQRELAISILFISHDMAVVEHMSDQIVVLYLGRVVETGTPREIFSAPRHPYTRALISAVPTVTRKARPVTLQGEVPSPLAPPKGCGFSTRCPFADSRCDRVPDLVALGGQHAAACHHLDRVAATAGPLAAPTAPL